MARPASRHLPLFDAPTDPAPQGFAYQADLLTVPEEEALCARLAGLDLKAYEFRGYAGKRRVAYFGWRYQDNILGVGEPPPAFLTPLRDKAAAFARVAPEALQQVLVNEYQPGAPIGWHRDRPAFGEVIGVSLLSPCILRFRRRRGEGWDRLACPLAPRSVYRLSGPAREDWEHSIRPAERLRYSVTFRTLRADQA